MNLFKSAFSLSKWYLDCVTEDGSTYIGYTTLLKWRGIRLRQTALLTYLNGESNYATSSASNKQFPIEDQGTICWCAPKLGMNGSWRPTSESIERVILKTDLGSLRWRCIQPGSEVQLTRSDGSLINGNGYVERLDMTIKPWDLPIDQLIWGRYVSAKNHVVWIEWQGAMPYQLIIHNGREIVGGSVSSQGVVIDSKTKLNFANSKVLREGNIGSTALAPLRGMRAILPGRIKDIHECKWRSEGVLRQAGEIVSQGWVIHEVVRF